MSRLEELTAYEIKERRPLPDLNSEGIILRHKKSGAKVAVLANDDENKVFYIGFRTPPADSTGVPHIIEHTVLCGSKKYPVKDPFVELVKGSLNTFLNAMTYPDKTIYPVASCNDKDFQNLIGVYMDAVFHPNIYQHEEIFKQEGWHYELEQADDPITINGVVYNEMKGAFSSADDVLQREVLASLFPDTAYANESGGNPDNIPDLTYEDYLDFHRKYYHPCNSYIYLYGDMDVAEKLDWMDKEYLSHYDKIEIDSAIQAQSAFGEPVEVERSYSISSGEPTEHNTYLSYNFVIGTILDKKLYQAFEVLDYALLSAPGAPLKQALLDAGIGMDITGGYDSSTLQPMFSVVAKHADLADKEKFLEIILTTLREQAQCGLNKKALLAGISSAEFRYREADYGRFPKGLMYGIWCLDSWLYDECEPFMHLEATETYRFLKEQVETDYFEQLIKTYLLENTHASIVTVVPERGLNAKKEEELAQKLAAYKDGLTEDEIEALIADTKRLKAYQEEPSPKEELEKIPMLTREDMKKETAPLLNEVRQAGDVPLLYHDIFTSGIDYLTFLFDATDVAPEDYPYLGLLKQVLGFVDTEQYGYADLANEINIQTGGIHTFASSFLREDGAFEIKYEVSLKALAEKLPNAASLVRQILMTSRFDDDKRLYELVAQTKSRLKMTMSMAGHATALMRAISYFSKTYYFNDAVTGIAFYEFIKDLEEHFEEKKTAVAEKLSALAQKLFTKERMMVSVTSERQHLQAAEQQAGELAELLYPSTGEERSVWELPLAKKNEGFMDASQVQYVARAGNFRAHGYAYSGALRILNVIMGYDYLWTNVRVKGGAYGCMNGYSRSGDTYFVSYRDPNLAKTNEVYEGIPAYLESFEADEHEMTKYIIGTISDMDTPLGPNAKGARSLAAYLQQVTIEDLQRERDEVIGATPEDIRALKPLIASVLQEDNLCVIGGEETIKKNAELFMEIKELV